MRAGKSLLPFDRPGPLTRMRGTPFSLLDELRDELDRFWKWPRAARGEVERELAWSPKIDVFEKKGQLLVKADLPGLKKEDVEVSVEEGDLILRGERKEESEVEEDSFYCAERFWGKFFRRVPLTFDVDPEAVKASFKDGVLEVTLPLPKEAKKAKAQKITVH